MCYIEDSLPDTPNSHYIAIREAKNAQRTIKELEKRNNEITAQLDKAKQESMNTSKNHVRRIQQLETELSQVKQLLLHEKTMKGEFVLNPIMQVINYKNNFDLFSLIDLLIFLFLFYSEMIHTRKKKLQTLPKKLQMVM